MPTVKLTREDEKAVVLAALSRDGTQEEIARRFGVSQSRVQQLAKRARENAALELAHWRRVAELVRG
jgi:DNA-directed RNA polymerase specialized sigma subunit